MLLLQIQKITENNPYGWEIFWFNILCSIIASLIFLFIVLIWFKPKIRISPFICKAKSKFDDTQFSYFIKMVNVSIFSAYDLKFELNLLQRYSVPPTGSMNVRTTPLKVVQSHLSHINPYRPYWWRKEASHAFRFRSIEDLTSIITDEFKSVEIQITVKHGLTGLTKVYKQEYSDVSQIKIGNFTYGTKFAVMQ